MPPGHSDPTESEDLSARLGRLVSTVDDAGRAQADRGQALVLALSDQLAAGQTETLYSLQTAASTVRERASALAQLAEQLPGEIAARVASLVDELAEASRTQISETMDEASSRLGVAFKSVQRDLAGHQAAHLEKLAQGADAVAQRLESQQESYLQVLRESAEETGSQLSNELETAAKTIVESASRAKASQTAVRAAAVAAVEALQGSAESAVAQLTELQQQLADLIAQAAEDIDQAASAFASDADAVTQGMTAVTESFISRLFEVLDERDERDRLLEERLSARIDRLTQRTAERMIEVAQGLEQQLARLEARDLAERARTADDLNALVERILREPRGKLRELRAGARQTAASPLPAVVAAPVASVHRESLWERSAEEVEPPASSRAPRVTKKAPAKSVDSTSAASGTTARKAPAKKAPAKKPAVQKAPAQKAAPRRTAKPAGPTKRPAKKEAS